LSTNVILNTRTEDSWLATAAVITAVGILFFEVLPMSYIQTVTAIAVKQHEEHNTYPITAITTSVKTREEDEHVIAIPSHGLFLLSDRKSTNLKSDQNEEAAASSDAIDERTEVIHGKQNVVNTVLQFTSNAKSRIDACVDYSRPSLAIEIEHLKKAFLDAKSRGVKLRYVTEVIENNIGYCKQLIKMVDELRHLDGVKANFAVSETEYVATSTLREAQPVPEVIYSNVKDVVEQQQYLFETLWKKSTSAEEKIRQFEEGTTPEYFEVFTDRDREVVSQILLELAKSVRKEALILLPNARAMVRVDRLGFIAYIIEASQKGATVKIICPLSDENSEILKKISEQAPAVTILNGDNCLYGMYIIDSEKFLRAELKEPKAEKFSEAIGFTVYSNNRVGVDSLRSVFELLWNERKLNEELKIHDKMQKEFIGIAAHELRNPIQPILGLAEIVKSKIKDAKQCEFLDVIIRNAKRLQRLTEDILDVTKIESQSLDLKKEQFNLSDVITNAINDIMINIDFLRKSQRNAIKLLYHQPQDIFIQADKGRITQVIFNLLSNAVKSTEQGTISVSLEKKEDNDHVVISLKDTGTGIDPGILPRLFTRFGTKSFAGTGLGLYISKSIVEAHGGKIGAENNSDGRGATFAFSLPLIIQQDRRQETMAINTTAATMINDIEERIKFHKTKIKRIFLVDDDYDHTITFKVGLELAGFEVDTYNDSAIALSNFKPDYYDLLLIDIKMPKIDGFELYERIRKIDAKVKVWFITAYEVYYKTLKEVSSKSKEETVLDRFIQKPIEINNLVKQIKSELD
jgi:two-component system sensor histidine kinase VicK